MQFSERRENLCRSLVPRCRSRRGTVAEPLNLLDFILYFIVVIQCIRLWVSIKTCIGITQASIDLEFSESL